MVTKTMGLIRVESPSGCGVCGSREETFACCCSHSLSPTTPPPSREGRRERESLTRGKLALAFCHCNKQTLGNKLLSLSLTPTRYKFARVHIEWGAAAAAGRAHIMRASEARYAPRIIAI